MATTTIEHEPQPVLLDTSPQRPTRSSWGEHLLPFLFAAIETCWIDAILLGLANVHLLGADQLLLPLWAPFVLIAGVYGVAHYLGRAGGVLSRVHSREISPPAGGHEGPHSASAPPPPLRDDGDAGTDAGTGDGRTLARLFVGVVIGLATLFVVWASIYAGQVFVLDPGWLLSLPGSVLQFDTDAFRIISVIVLCITLCRHGDFLARHVIKPEQVLKMLRFGAIVIVALIVLRAVLQSIGWQLHDGLAVVLIVALFFSLSLIAHALSRVALLRRTHRGGLTGSIGAQERLLLQTISVLSFFSLCIALMAGGIFDPAQLAALGNRLGPVFDWLSALHVSKKVPTQMPLPPIRPACVPTAKHACVARGEPAQPIIQQHAAHTTVSGILTSQLIAVLMLVLLLLLAVAVVIAGVWLFRRWRRRRNAQRAELHESLWSWSLFGEQFKALFYALLARFLPRRAAREGEQPYLEESEFAPATRGVREMYRTLLARSARQGYPRIDNETPYEFRLRLAGLFPLVEPQLSLLTEAYTAARYGNLIPDETEVRQLQGLWAQLEQQWEM